MNEPTLQTEAEFRTVDDKRLTEIAVVNPSIALLKTHGRLTILISRDTHREAGAIQFVGSRLVHIPLGWRLSVLKLLARIGRGRLPNEHEFRRVQIVQYPRSSIATAEGGFLCSVEDSKLVKTLTGHEYFELMTMRGRDLHRWIEEHFPACGTKGAGFANGQAERRRVA